MLGKLTKHELFAVGRLAIPAYIGVLIISVVGRFLTWLSSRQYVIDNVPDTFVKLIKILSSTISFIYIIIFMSLLILTFFMMIYRFYKSFFTDEGYLMMTLPVRPTSLIFSKLFNSWIWIILSILIAGLSLYITLGHYDSIIDTLKDLWDAIGKIIEREGDFIRDELGVPIWVFGLELFALVFLFVTRTVLSWYASVSFGMLLSKKHKIVGTIAAYFIIYVVTQIIMAIYLFVITKVIPDYYDVLLSSTGKALQITVGGSAFIYLIFSTALFAFTSHIMTHRLNLD